MRRIDAIVLIERTSNLYINDIERVEKAGLTGIFSMFHEVILMHELAHAIAGDTFKFRIGNEVNDTFNEQCETLLSEKDGEKHFINFAIGMNPEMAEEIPQAMKMAAVVDLANLNLSMVQKMIHVGNQGVDMRDLFADDYVYNCIRELCGFEVIGPYRKFLGDASVTPEEFLEDLIIIDEILSKG